MTSLNQAPRGPTPWPFCTILAFYIPVFLFFATFTFGWRVGGTSTGRVYIALLYGVPGTIAGILIGIALAVAARQRQERPTESPAAGIALLLLICGSVAYCRG